MKKSIKPQIIITCAVFILWAILIILVFFIPNLFSKDNYGEYLRRFEIAILSASSLSSALMVLIAFLSLKKDKQGLLDQLHMQARLESIHSLMDDEYTQSKQYIGSKDYYRDVNTIKKVINTADENITLSDFYQVLYKHMRGKNGETLDDAGEEKLKDSYRKITSFCMKMNNLGIIAKNDPTGLVSTCYSLTITETYKALKDLFGDKEEKMYASFIELNKSAEEKLKKIS